MMAWRLVVAMRGANKVDTALGRHAIASSSGKPAWEPGYVHHDFSLLLKLSVLLYVLLCGSAH